jgi:hypothetical protein
MKTSSSDRLRVAVFVAILLCSSATMLWLFWRFPIATGVVTVAIVIAVSLSTRLAKLSDGESFERNAHKQGAQPH